MSFDDFDPFGYIYLNPELEHIIENSVEGAYVHNSNTIGTKLKNDLTQIPQEFDHIIYYNLKKNEIDSFFLNGSFSYCNYFDTNDIERMAKIHYTYSNGPHDVFTISPTFNPDLYRLFHKVPEELSSSELYYSYLSNQNSQELVIGNINDLGFQIRENVSLEFNDLIVRGESVHRGNLYVDSNIYVAGIMELTSNELIINGGSLQINADYAHLNSVVTKRIVKEDVLTSNMTVLDVATFHSNVTIASNLTAQTIDVSTLTVGGLSPAWDGHASNLYGLSNLALSALSNDLNLETAMTTSNLIVHELATFSNIKIGAIDVSNSNSTVVFDGSVQADNFPQTSDRTLKRNITLVDESQSVRGIENINVYNYNLLNDNIPKTGVIAQEIQTIFPDLVFPQNKFIPEHSNIDLILTNEQINIGLVHVPNLNEYHQIILTPMIDNVEKEISEVRFDLIRAYDYTTSVSVPIPQPNESVRFHIKGYIKQQLSVDYTQLFCHLLVAYKDLKKTISNNNAV